MKKCRLLIAFIAIVHTLDAQNVGIGTTTPANKLSVVGNADFTGTVGIGTPTTPNPYYKLNILGGYEARIGVEALDIGFAGIRFKNTQGQFYAGIIGDKFSLGTSDGPAGTGLSIESGNHFGMGINPIFGYRLVVYNALLVEFGKLVVNTNGFSDQGLVHKNGLVSVGTAISVSGPVGGCIGTFTNHPLGLFTNYKISTPSLLVDTSGKVGIGTINPAARLDVAGNVKIADGTQGAGKVLTSDAAGIASWQAVNAITAFADFYAVMPGDNAVIVTTGSAVTFPQNGASNGVITRTSASAFNLPAIGTYEIIFVVSVNEPGQLVVAINGSELLYTIAGRASGSSQIAGSCLITTTVINSIISINNPITNFNALTISPSAGGANPVSAHLVIKKLN